MVSLVLLLSTIGVVSAQDRMNEFVVTIDESHNPMTIYSSYGATPNDGVVIINSTISDLEFSILSVNDGRLRKVVQDKDNNRYLLIIQPNDINYKQYTITIKANGFLRGKIDSVVVKAGLSSGYIVNPKYDFNALTHNTIGGHEYVDLGLPSGTLWATCNVGAFNPEGQGNHYAWGETSYKGRYSYNRNDYKYMKDGDTFKVTKYCYEKLYGYRRHTDYISTLEACDDAATSNWGNGWRTPTKYQWEELKDKCRWTWISGGYKVVGPNGNSIFLPAAGAYNENGFVSSGGAYWSASLDTEFSSDSWGLLFTSDGIKIHFFRRYNGFSVRPVCSFRK